MIAEIFHLSIKIFSQFPSELGCLIWWHEKEPDNFGVPKYHWRSNTVIIIHLDDIFTTGGSIEDQSSK